jgi:hypothetical protein
MRPVIILYVLLASLLYCLPDGGNLWVRALEISGYRNI